jgi:hypothetical protein
MAAKPRGLPVLVGGVVVRPVAARWEEVAIQWKEWVVERKKAGRKSRVAPLGSGRKNLKNLMQLQYLERFAKYCIHVVEQNVGAGLFG